MGVLKLEKPEAMQNISFLWNDVACLADDNCSFVICKSMVRLSAELPAMERLEKINIRSITRSINAARSKEPEMNGEIAVEITYVTMEQEQMEAAFAVPFSGSYFGTWERSNRPQVVYVDGQAVGFDHVLLETVLAVPNSSNLLREEERVIGEFHHEQRIELPAELPTWTQIIGTQVAFDINDWQCRDGELTVIGEQQIKLLYAADREQGEKVMFYQKPQGFSVVMAAEELLSDDTQLAIGYRSLIAHLLNDKEAVLDINCTIMAAGGQRMVAELTVDETAVSAADQLILAETEPERMEEAEVSTVIQEPAAAPKMPPMNSRPPRRPSKRDNLLKYMRNLDRGVKTAQCNKNIAILPEEAAETAGQENAPVIEE